MSVKLSDEALEKLTELRANIQDDVYKNIQILAAWRYGIPWLSSFTRVLKKGVGLEDVELNIAQRNQFAFSYDKKKPEHFGLIVQSADYFWLRDINIRSVTILDDGIVLFISELRAYGFYIAGLAIKIPFALSHREMLREAKLKARNLWLIRLDNNKGQLAFKEIHKTPILISDKPYKSVREKKRYF
jgi:hypothetical protein